MKNLAGGAESVYEKESEGGRALSSALERELGPYLFIPIVTVQDFISVSERLPRRSPCQFIYLRVTKRSPPPSFTWNGSKFGSLGRRMRVIVTFGRV